MNTHHPTFHTPACPPAHLPAAHRPLAAAGFGLIEIVVALAVLALLSGLAIPAFNDFLARQQAYGVASALFADLSRARGEAVRSARPVVLCASRDGRQCGDHPWHTGWLMAVDDNRDGLIEAHEPLLTVRGGAPPGLVIGWRNDNIALSFHPNGLTPAISGVFTICESGAARPLYAIHFHWSGRARLSGAEDAATVHCPR